jgi:xylulokinase
MAQAAYLEKRYGREPLFDLTGAPLHAFCVIPKVLWFKENKPDLFAKAWKFSGLQEIIHQRLGLQPRMDLALAGRTMLIDIRNNCYARQIMEENGINPDCFFPLSRGDYVVGELTEGAAEPLNLSKGTKVVTGGFDQSCCALGAGVIDSGKTAVSVGTLEAITPVFDSLRLDPPLLEGNHGCIPGLVPELFTSLGYVTTSGGIVKWYHDYISPSKQEDYTSMFAGMPDNPSKVYVLPYFAGSGTPWLDVNQYGSVFGLDLDTSPETLLKGILEGICYEVRLNIASFTGSGIPVTSLRAVGGGSKSAEWMQIKADSTGIPVETTSIPEAGCRGAAFLAGLGNGTYTSLQSITELTRVDRVFEPDPQRHQIYSERFEIYNALRSRVEGLNLSTS